VKEPEEFDRELVLAIWPRLERMIVALGKVGIFVNVDRTQAFVATLKGRNDEGVITNDHVATAIRLLALQDSMAPHDWLRMKAVDAAMPRKRTPPALDLQLRLKRINARSLVAKVVQRENGSELARVTIKSARGDVASCEAPGFAEALEAAIQMAGAHGKHEGGHTR